MNVVILIGRLAVDPKIRWANENTKVANFKLAVSRPKRKDEPEEADFIRVVAFGRRAELVENYCPKGKQIAVMGRLQTRTYEGQDGTKRTITEVIAKDIMLLASPKGNGNTTIEEDYNMEDPFEIPPEEEFKFDGIPDESEDDLPF
ncbi:Single-stranded DNA-binding protein A [Fervidicola ferrireducens]|uniref:Single-stranded DNA-binding protein n=1 Tax=Fervidicola ferrireducens TaxID=520764 RepID=A0A140L4P9_9FIRM|nr:single-stranded DNA-binding protein [Fervidicola ferrireducens]KXG75524.1 Single-stranded DNA-binding protein A [Fervidicola ferrireducens]